MTLGPRLVTALALLYAAGHSGIVGFIAAAAGLIGGIFVPSEPSAYQSAEQIAAANAKVTELVVTGVVFLVLGFLELASAASIMGERPRLAVAGSALGLAGAIQHMVSVAAKDASPPSIAPSAAAAACCLLALGMSVYALRRKPEPALPVEADGG